MLMIAHRSRAAILVLVAAIFGGPAAVADEKTEFFETHVRPLLAKHCFECHSDKKQQGEVRLDEQSRVMGSEDHDPLVIPGKPEESRIMQVLAYDPLDVQMPPTGKLPEKKIATLKRWIEQGAVWPASAPASASPTDEKKMKTAAATSHWAFQPISSTAPPTVKHPERTNNAIDRFLLARLEEKSLSFSPPAENRTLLRRVYLDLVGIPPTPEQMDAFLADDSPNAFSKVVEELLASPRYGQRWARHWLDIARYADTKGYVFQEDINYPYAYTYRDYVVDAFNSDKPYDRFIIEQVAADRLDLPPNAPELAALGFLTVGRRNLNNTHDIIDDRIDVTTRGLMGLTVTCARCHDHKFDPIPTADYYSLYGVFASTTEPTGTDLPLIGTPPKTPAYAKFQAELKKRRNALASYLQKQQAVIERKMRLEAETRLLAVLHGPEAFPKVPRQEIAIWKTFLKRVSDTDPVWAAWKRLHDVPAKVFATRADEVFAALRKRPEFQSGVGAAVLKSLSQKPLTSADDLARVYGAMIATNADRPKELSDENAARLDARDAHLRSLGAPFTISEDDFRRLRNTKQRNEYRTLERKIDQHVAKSPAAPPRAMVLVDRENPVKPAIFERGSPGRRGERVPRRFLKVLSEGQREPFPKDASGRLEMARLIADKDNPLTARVIVNRLWQHHFGKGIVESTSNFGLQGSPPSHPRLLDWLATEFIRRGWSIKEMHRLIVRSAAYQQSSLDRATDDPRLAKIDPMNRLVWRMNPKRMGFEAMRDSTLAVAGRLDPAIGGRPIKLFEKDSRRRTIYGYVNRNDLPGVRRNFDFPSPIATVGERPRTTVPQQALFAMNSPFVIAQAKALADREEIAAASEPRQRVRQLYRHVLQRAPRPSEVGAGLAFLNADSSDSKGLDRITQLAQVLLLTNEFMFVE